MFAKVSSLAVEGIEGVLIEVEVDLTFKVPCFILVGLPDTAVRESRDRVKTAMRNCGYTFPYCRILINLAPADIKKQGPQYDLPIALGLLIASEQIPATRIEATAVIGELSLDGAVRPVKGILSMVEAASRAGKRYFLCPAANAREAAAAESIAVYPVETIRDAVEFLLAATPPAPFRYIPPTFADAKGFTPDYGEVQGQEFAKRAMLVAAAGRHHCLLLGPPGAGKSMIASRLPSILPSLTKSLAIETMKIHSIAGMLATNTFIHTPPFRAPHHTVSNIGLVGGGTFLHPGEISLAHNGVLFLDELPEFQRNTLEILRQPLESGQVLIARARGRVHYPARFLLIAAMNPCPCGYYTDTSNKCRCSLRMVERYRSRISGPLIDRFDLQLEVPAVKYEELIAQNCGMNSAEMAERVLIARERQRKRLERYNIYHNCEMPVALIAKHCRLNTASKKLLRQAMDTLGFSARAYQKVLKVSRTIADIEECSDISDEHIAEALQYRILDRKILL